MMAMTRVTALAAAVLLASCGSSKPAPQTGGDGAGGPSARVADRGGKGGGGDKDGDGIPDDRDECPEMAESDNGIDDSDGCPESDQDRDGLYGSADKCPSEPEDFDGDRDDDGCPDVDGDNDGVADSIDQCPDKLETMNGYKDADGCPDEVPPPVKKFSGTIEGIAFKSGAATIASKSYPTLREAAKVLAKYPEVRLEIQGYTDNVGDVETNVRLSQKRAEAVRAYLIKRGVDGGRLTARGYGPANPRADNSTKAGQAKNRRVEFKLISDRPEP